MRSILKFFIATSIAASAALPALAESMTIPAGKTSSLGIWYTYNRNCHYGSMPKFKINKQPEHGTVSARWQAWKMGDATRQCKGKPMKGMLVTYTPQKGYRGTDIVKFSLIGSGLGPGTAYNLSSGFRYDLTIK